MAIPFITFPDAEQLVTTFLRVHLTGVLTGTVIPEDIQSAGKVVIVSRIGGGVSTPLVTDEAVLDVQVYAPDKATAHDLAQAVRAYLYTMPEASTPGARVYRVQDLAGLIWTPDAINDLPRYTLTFQLLIRGE